MAPEPRYTSWGEPLLKAVQVLCFFPHLKYYTFVCILVIFKLLTSSSGLIGGNWTKSHHTLLPRTVPTLNLKTTVFGVLLSSAYSRAVVSSVFASNSAFLCDTHPAECSYVYRCLNFHRTHLCYQCLLLLFFTVVLILG